MYKFIKSIANETDDRYNYRFIVDLAKRIVLDVNSLDETWYEIFIDKGEEGTEPIAKAHTLEQAKEDAKELKEHYSNYPMYIDKWYVNKEEVPMPDETFKAIEVK